MASLKGEKAAKYLLLGTLFLLPIAGTLNISLIESFQYLIIITAATALAFLGIFRAFPTMEIFRSGSNLRPKFWLAVLLEVLLIASFYFSQSRGTSASGLPYLSLLTLPVLFFLTTLGPMLTTQEVRKSIVLSGLAAASFTLIFLLVGRTNTWETSIFLTIVIIFCLEGLEGRETREKAVTAVTLVLSTLALLLINPLTGQLFGLALTGPANPDVKTSLSVSQAAFNSFPILGLGPNLYKTAFSLYKPLFFNESPESFRGFNQGSNFWLTWLPQIGLLAVFVLLIFLVLAVFAGSSTPSGKREVRPPAARVSLIILLISTFLTNLGPALLYLVFFLGAQAATVKENPSKVRSSSIKKGVLTALTVLLILVTTLSFINVAASSLYAIGSTRKERGGIEFKEKAASLNPRLDLYHRELAKEYLATARSSSQRDLMTQYVRKSLLSAKTAISLNRWDSQNYRTAASIYTDLIGTVSGASSSAQSYLIQAIALSPYDPRLRLDLARLYLLTGREEAALAPLAEAIRLKADYTEAHYQLAKLLVRLKRYPLAKEQYRLTLATISDNHSPFFLKIEEEMRVLFGGK